MPKPSSTKKKPKADDSDDDYTVADESIEGLSEKFSKLGGGTKASNKGVKQLALDVVGNPLDIKLTYGAPRRQSDDGSILLSSLYLSLPFADIRDMADITVQLNTTHGTSKDGNSSIITVSQPIIPKSAVEVLTARLKQYHKEIKEYYKGNKKVSKKSMDAWHESRLQNISSHYTKYIDTRTGKGRVVSYNFELPCCPLTGRQLYVNNQYWQGTNHAEGSPDDSNYLAGCFQFQNTKQEIDKKTTVNVVYMSFDYEIPLAGGEGTDLNSVMSASKPPPKNRGFKSKVKAVVSNQKNEAKEESKDNEEEEEEEEKEEEEEEEEEEEDEEEEEEEDDGNDYGMEYN